MQESTKYEMALKSKDDEIGFLRGHVAQLTQSISQFALRPGDEEIKKKGWWRFWQSHKTFYDLRYCRKIRARGFIGY